MIENAVLTEQDVCATLAAPHLLYSIKHYIMQKVKLSDALKVVKITIGHGTISGMGAINGTLYFSVHDVAYSMREDALYHDNGVWSIVTIVGQDTKTMRAVFSKLGAKQGYLLDISFEEMKSLIGTQS